MPRTSGLPQQASICACPSLSTASPPVTSSASPAGMARQFPRSSSTRAPETSPPLDDLGHAHGDDVQFGRLGQTETDRPVTGAGVAPMSDPAATVDLVTIAVPQPTAYGEVFTRRWVVEAILDLVGYTPDRNLGGMRLVEPSIGSGAFIVPIVERLIDSARERSAPPRGGSEVGDRLAHAQVLGLGFAHQLRPCGGPQSASQEKCVFLRHARRASHPIPRIRFSFQPRRG